MEESTSSQGREMVIDNFFLVVKKVRNNVKRLANNFHFSDAYRESWFVISDEGKKQFRFRCSSSILLRRKFCTNKTLSFRQNWIICNAKALEWKTWDATWGSEGWDESSHTHIDWHKTCSTVSASTAWRLFLQHKNSLLSYHKHRSTAARLFIFRINIREEKHVHVFATKGRKKVKQTNSMQLVHLLSFLPDVE